MHIEARTRFLTLAEAIEIHDYQIEHFGGIDGLRSIDLLESAVGVPESSFGGNYLHSTIPDMAAAYPFHLVENHPFADGNMRAGATAAPVFLELKGYEFNASNEELIRVVLQVASGNMPKETPFQFFRQHSRCS